MDWFRGRLLFFLSFFVCGISFGAVVNDQSHDDRYTLIQSLLDRYERSFTIIDIGASDNGFYSFKIAREYNAVCVMATTEQLLDVCKAEEDIQSLILLNHEFMPRELQHLSECEHFDVVLVLQFAKRYGSQWQAAFDALLQMGDHSIIEISTDAHAIKEYSAKKGGKSLGMVCGRDGECTELHLIQSKNLYLRRTSWLRHLIKNFENYYIESSFSSKQLIKNRYEYTDWVPGINLCTFKMCHGVYPTTETLKAQLYELQTVQHTDWLINNMIVQGNTLVMIDGSDTERSAFCTQKLLRAHLHIVDLQEPRDVAAYFWHINAGPPLFRDSLLNFIARFFK